MALTPTSRWNAEAVSGRSEPVLKFEFNPTVAYDELNCRSDWYGGEDDGNLDVDHQSEQLRLLRNRTTDHEECQLRQNKDFWPIMEKYDAQRVHAGYTLGRLVQIFRSDSSFKLKELHMSINYREDYTGRLTVRILTGLSEAIADRSQHTGASHVDRVLEGARELGKLEIDFSSKVPVATDDDPFGRWVVLDFSKDNIWIPGGDIPCAIVLEATDGKRSDVLWIQGSENEQSYSKGSLYWGIPNRKRYWLQEGNLAFKFKIDAFAQSGEGTWILDMGKDRPQGAEGELEIRYCEPEGTLAKFWITESDSSTSVNKWRRVSDGSAVSKRYIKLKATLFSDKFGIDTPRILSIRAAFKQKVNWLLASRPMFGYPNLVAEAPDYSAEGDPLSGSASATDTSRIVLMDPGGIASELFSSYNMKNDKVNIWLGFDSPEFIDHGGAEAADWLPFKTVWIEDWQPGEGKLEVHCYDQQIRFRKAQAPFQADSPEQNEEIHYDRANPARVKYDLLRRAGIRRSEIDYDHAEGTLAPVGDTDQSFTRLGKAFDWEVNYGLARPTGLETVDSELNRHLLAFQLVDERGKWVVRYADFNCDYNLQEGWRRYETALPTVENEHLAAGSETFSPGLKHLRNWGLVYFGGSGGDGAAYSCLTVSPGPVSAKAHKESATDKLYSAFIPADREDQAGSVALRRRLMQQGGVRTVQFTTGLRYAHLQIGEHINFNSNFYRRPGAISPNPLLVMITRKNIDSNLSAIHWAGIVLLDAEQTASEEYQFNPPSDLLVSPLGEGTASWTWQAAVNEQSSGVDSYELFQRLSNMRDWGAPVASVEADGSAAYEWTGSAYDEALQYDCGVRSVHISGARSPVVSYDNMVLTGPVPDAPGGDDWQIRSEPGCLIVSMINQVNGATSYRLFVLVGEDWLEQGIFTFGEKFVYEVPNPYGSGIHKLAISAASRWGKSEMSEHKFQRNRPLDPSSFVPTAPQFDSGGGTFPLISRLPVGSYHAFSIIVRFSPLQSEADMIGRYELERRNKLDQGGEEWSVWSGLTEYIIKQDDLTPTPYVIHYDNTDSRLKPGHIYQYRVRAVSRWEVPGEWSEIEGVLLTDDTTGPDQPTVTLYEETGRTRLVISEPAIGGGPCPDFSHFVVEGQPSGGAWEVLDPHWTNTVFFHTGPDSDLEVDWDYRVTALDHSGNASPTGAAQQPGKKKKVSTTSLADSVVGTGTPGTLSKITENAGEIDLRVQYDEVVNSINISSEGIRIDASKLMISGSTTFSSGYNPSTKAEESYVDSSVSPKLDHTGGAYNSAASGARVRIFPDANTGIQVTDGTNDVFKVLVGGDDVGDVVIGDESGQHVKWDKSAAELVIKAGSATDYIKITGNSAAAYLQVWDTDNVSALYPCVYLKSAAYGGEPGIHVSDKPVSNLRRMSYLLGGKLQFATWSDSIHNFIGGAASIECSRAATYDEEQLILTSGINMPVKVTLPLWEDSGIALHVFGKTKTDTSYMVGSNVVVGAQQTGISPMTNLTAPSNWDADTVTTAQLADIVGTLINKLRTHGLVAT